MYTIAKRWTFDAAHRLPNMPTGHKCGRVHGHTYAVEVQLTAETLDERGFVVDYGDLGWVKRFVDEVLDHRWLNERLPAWALPATAENLARFVYEIVANGYGTEEDMTMTFGDGETHAFPPTPRLREGVQVAAVRVSETGSTWAEYRETTT